VISHNYGRFLREAVESVLRQTRIPRLVVMDDGSTDETRAIGRELARQSDNAIAYWRNRTRRGVSETRNEAARRVESPWIVFLDADDWLRHDFIAHGEAWLDRHPRVDALTTDLTIVEAGRAPTEWVARVPDSWTALLRGNTIAQTSFIRRDMIRDLGGYDGALVYEDWDFWIRALQRGYRIRRLPGAHVFRREHDLNKGKLGDHRRAVRQVHEKHRAAADASGDDNGLPGR
jgi:glycosyltransferase involved in cell wall biosynthesis